MVLLANQEYAQGSSFYKRDLSQWEFGTSPSLGVCMFNLLRSVIVIVNH